MHTKRTALLLIIVLIAIGIAGRLLPHLPNATPIAALAFVGSIYFGRKVAFLLPIGVLFFTDVIIGFYSLGIMISVYGSFALIALMSWWLKKHTSILAIGYTAMGASVSFFLITNAAVWWFTPWYEKSFLGLLYSYELGLPFFRNMLMGDLVYTFSILGVLAALPHILSLSRKIFTSVITVRTPADM